MSARDLFVAGVVAYAAEGDKRKPWQTSASVKFINSDARMMTPPLALTDRSGPFLPHVPCSDPPRRRCGSGVAHLVRCCRRSG